jgi:hypothetical protein
MLLYYILSSSRTIEMNFITNDKIIRFFEQSFKDAMNFYDSETISHDLYNDQEQFTFYAILQGCLILK